MHVRERTLRIEPAPARERPLADGLPFVHTVRSRPSTATIAIWIATVSLLALVLCMPLVPHGASISIAKHCTFLALATLGATALGVATLRGAVVLSPDSGVARALLAYFAVAVPAAWFAHNAGIAIYTLGLLLAHALTFVLAATLLTRSSAVARVAAAVLCAGCVVALVGLTGYARFVGSDAPESSRTSLLATPFFRHSYLAAQYVVMIVVGAIAWLLERGRRDRIGLVVALATLPMIAFLVVIGSRAAYLAVGVAMVVHLVLRSGALRGGRATRSRVVRGLVGVALSVGLVVALVPGAFEFARLRVSSLFQVEASTNSFARLTIWRDTMRMVADHPLFGVGPGTFDTAFTRYHAAWPAVPHAHNQLVQDLAELGLVGLIALLFVLRHAIRAIGAGARDVGVDHVTPTLGAHRDEAAERARWRPLFHAAVAALVACGTYFGFETPLRWPEAGTLALVALAVVAQHGRRHIVTPLRGRVALGGLVALAIALGVIGPSWTAHARASTAMARCAAELRAADVARAAGRIELADGIRESALERMEQADAEFPWKTAPLVVRAEQLLHLGRFEEALAATRVADSRAPAQLDVLTRQALALMQLGRHDEALIPLRRAIVAHHGDDAVEATITMGRAYAALHRHEEALRVFQALIDPRVHHDARRPELLLDAARAHLALGRDLDVAAALIARHRERVNSGREAALASELEREVVDASNRSPRPACPRSGCSSRH